MYNSEVCMREIKKRILPKYFEEVKSGKEQIELVEDECIEVGDKLILEEWYGVYTGRSYEALIQKVLNSVGNKYCIVRI